MCRFTPLFENHSRVLYGGNENTASKKKCFGYQNKGKPVARLEVECSGEYEALFYFIVIILSSELYIIFPTFLHLVLRRHAKIENNARLPQKILISSSFPFLGHLSHHAINSALLSWCYLGESPFSDQTIGSQMLLVKNLIRDGCNC